MHHAYPLTLDVSHLRIVIVGGGGVAARKAAGLLAAGARRVSAVALEFCADFPLAIERISADYRADHLIGALIVFVATDSPAVNDAVEIDARAIGALVNRADADEAHPGDFAVPAIMRRGGILVAVNTGGAPALAAVLRDQIDQSLGTHWHELADAVGELRRQLRRDVADPSRRRDVMRLAVCKEAIAAWCQDGAAGWRAWLSARLTADLFIGKA